MLSVPEWEQRDRFLFERMVREPRLTAEYRDLTGAPIPLLREIADALSTRYGVRYDGLWLNLYRSHHDSTSWHADKPPSRVPTSIVPVLSLGATRRFLIRPREGGASHAWQPEAGDLIVMGGKCQRGWVHCVPKQAQSAGPRVSLNFTSSSQNVA
jgi:alkylated DNA repair dioxygenase AlkB